MENEELNIFGETGETPESRPDPRLEDHEDRSPYWFDEKAGDEEENKEWNDDDGPSEAALAALYEQSLNIAGAIARHYERIGLIHGADDFSWEWHAQFGADFETAQAAAAEQAAGAGPEGAAPTGAGAGDAGASGSAGQGAGEGSASGGTGGAGGDMGFGSGFGGNFGAGFGG